MGIPVSGDGSTSKSLVRFGAGVRISPRITSHIMMILALNWNHLYHCPQLGPSSVGILNLLISILVKLSCLCFLRMKGAYISRCQRPRESLRCCLACRTKRLILADARCLSMNERILMELKRGWSVYWWPYKIVWIYGTESGGWSSWWRVC